MSEHDPLETTATEDPLGVSKLVPVGESIKYRRRAQQAEAQLQQTEQRLDELQQQLAANTEQLGTAEAQRDEVHSQLSAAENRLAIERVLNQAGVVDPDTASMLLARRIDMTEPCEGEQLARAVEELLLEKPFLRATDSALLPPATASARADAPSTTAQLAEAADQAIRTGDRRDVAEYLRLRRQTALHS